MKFRYFFPKIIIFRCKNLISFDLIYVSYKSYKCVHHDADTIPLMVVSTFFGSLDRYIASVGYFGSKLAQLTMTKTICVLVFKHDKLADNYLFTPDVPLKQIRRTYRSKKRK